MSIINRKLIARLRRAEGVSEIDDILKQEGFKKIRFPKKPSGAFRKLFRSADDLFNAKIGEITVREAASILGVTKQTIQRHLRSGVIRSRSVGPVKIVDVASLKRYAARHGRSLSAD